MNTTICCRGCDTEIGDFTDYGFLVDETNGKQSYHFVIKKELMTVFIKDNFIVDDELHEKRYYHVKCNQCDNEIGKKFVKSTDKYSNSYIAFGKEKLKYGDVTIEKNNYWTNFINLTYFKDMTRYKKYDFNDNIVEIKKSNSSRYVPPSHRLHDINSNNNNYNDNNNNNSNNFNDT